MSDQTQAQFDREVAEYAAMGLDPAAEIAAMTTPASVTAPPAASQYDRRLIANARAIAAAKAAADIRTAITAAYPAHAPAMAELDDSMTWAYANGVMAQLMTELAAVAERELNRNA